MNKNRTISSTSRMSLMLVVISFLLSFVPSPGNAGHQARTFKATQTEEIVRPEQKRKISFVYGVFVTSSTYSSAIDGRKLIAFHTRESAQNISNSRRHFISSPDPYRIHYSTTDDLPGIS